MLFILFRISISLLINCIFVGNLYAITIGTYSSPPYSMYEDGEEIGLATEAVRALLEQSQIKDYTIINYPLARGLAELQYGRIDIYYPYMHSADEAVKNSYVLIGPISRYNVALFVRKDYAHSVSIPAMKNLVIGAERGSVSALLLQKHEMHVEEATQPVSCLRMVLADRITACAIGTLPGMYSAAINNIGQELRFVETGSYADMYVALGSNLSPEVIAKIRDTYEQLKEENFFQLQQAEYEKKFAVFMKSLS